MYSISYYFCIVINLNIFFMLSFTILLPSKSAGRVYVYDHYGEEISQLASIHELFDYFYNWSVKFSHKSLTYSFTKDKDVILVELD